jgi:hypothetical protein
MQRFIAILAVIMIGCQAARVSEPLTRTLASDESQLDFWHELNNRPVTCNDDAFHGVLLFLDQADPNPDYSARVNALKTRGLLPKDFDRPGDEAVSRGTMALVISKTLAIKGGMMLHLSPDCPRYAVRELVYLELYPPSTPNQTFSGADFVGIIGRVEDYQRGDNTDLAGSEMPQ